MDVAIIAKSDTGIVRAEGLAEREWVDVETRSKPKAVVLDPRVRTHDWNMLNNRKRVGSFWSRLFSSKPGVERYFHPYFSTRSRRDRITIGWQPTVWYNDAGGVTLGLRTLTDYMGRFEQNQSLVSASTKWGTDNGVEDTDFFFRLRNPVTLRAPNLSQTLDVFNVEGRYGAAASLQWSRRAHLNSGPVRSRSLTLQWVATDDFRYLDPGLYDPVGTVELRFGSGIATTSGKWQLATRVNTGGGLAYNRQGLAASGRPDLDPFYFRGSLEATARRGLGRSLGLGARLFVGAATGDHAAAKQRQFYVQGADPLEQLNNPFLRSRGALLVGEDFHYQAPGGAGVRGVDSRVSTGVLAGFNLELERAVLTRASARLFNRVSVAGFGDLGYGDNVHFLGDAGLGIRADHRIGDTRFTTRFDVPLYVSRPALAQDREPGDDHFAFRWTFSFEPGL